MRWTLTLLEGDFAIQQYNQLSVKPEAMLRVAREAQKLNCSVCMVHTHSMSHGEVAFSRADDIGNVDTFNFFTRMLPNRPNSCLVWDAELACVEGRIYTSGDNWELVDSVEVVSGDNRYVFTSSYQESIIPTQFDRQAKLLGVEGQSALKKLHIGVVGCGGLGSIASSLLAHSGISQITLIDFDVLEQTNLPRILGSSLSDVFSKLLKVDVAKRYINQHAPETQVQTYSLPVEHESLLKSLVTLDAIICCTDDTTSRAFLNQLCHQYYVPILDLGVQFVADEVTGELVKEIGRVHLMRPSSACMLCTGDISSKRLADEGLTPDDISRRVAGGYIVNANISEPSMMVFNMQVAARGIQHLISWVTGLSPVSEEQYEQYRFLGLTTLTGIKQIKKRGIDNCPICSSSSTILGNGDLQEMWVKPRPK